MTVTDDQRIEITEGQLTNELRDAIKQVLKADQRPWRTLDALTGDAIDALRDASAELFKECER